MTHHEATLAFAIRELPELDWQIGRLAPPGASAGDVRFWRWVGTVPMTETGAHSRRSVICPNDRFLHRPCRGSKAE